MLACEITNLTCSRLSRVAGRCLSADVWVKMSHCAGAVAVGGDGGVVDVVDYTIASLVSITKGKGHEWLEFLGTYGKALSSHQGNRRD